MAHPDLDELLNALLPFAHQMVQEHGEFFPFGAGMALDGEISSVGAYTGDEHPSGADVINLLEDGFRDRAGKGQLRGMGVCLNVRLVPPGQEETSDAICVRLEHREGQTIEVYQSYKRGESDDWVYGDLFAVPGERRIFING